MKNNFRPTEFFFLRTKKYFLPTEWKYMGIYLVFCFFLFNFADGKGNLVADAAWCKGIRWESGTVPAAVIPIMEVCSYDATDDSIENWKLKIEKSGR